MTRFEAFSAMSPDVRDAEMWLLLEALSDDALNQPVPVVVVPEEIPPRIIQ